MLDKNKLLLTSGCGAQKKMKTEKEKLESLESRIVRLSESLQYNLFKEKKNTLAI